MVLDTVNQRIVPESPYGTSGSVRLVNKPKGGDVPENAWFNLGNGICGLI